MSRIFGWVGKILRIDLTEKEVSTSSTLDYAEKYIGGRGIAARIAWEELGPKVNEFSPENILIVMTGPLVGTIAPSSGKVEFCALAPQPYPKSWFTRSCMGGWFGSELKYAGYDGLIIEGRAENPVYMWIDDQRVEIEDGSEIWGRDTFSTQKYLMDNHGSDVKTISIGPAGENLVRLATVQSETKNAAGQGGFGAVMGSKNLKAITVHGTRAVNIAKPDAFMEICMAITKEEKIGREYKGMSISEPADPDMERKYGLKLVACSQACPRRCGKMWANVPGKAYPGINTTCLMCSANLFKGHRKFYDWNLGLEAGVEVSSVANKLGINHFELLLGFIPWLRECVNEGLIKEIDGTPIVLSSPEFWVTLLKKISYREGIGDILAEGGPRAADTLGKGKDIIKRFYPTYGYAAHYDGHGDYDNVISFPFWVVSALQWLTDSKDPIASGHDYVENLTTWIDILSLEKIIKLSKVIYGSEKSTDPRFPYEFKAQTAIQVQHESVLKDSLLLCDKMFPLYYSSRYEDGYYKIKTSEYGMIGGKSLEYYLYIAATGNDISESEFLKCAERIFNLERAIQIRNYDRRKKDDLTVVPYFERPELFPGPSGKAESLDRNKFLKLVNEYYELRGWDKKTGIPTREKLESLDLRDVADELESLQ